MEIRHVEAVPLRRELDERFANAQKWIDSREYCLVRIETADGAVGWGECWGPIAGTRELIDDRIAAVLRGRDAERVESVHGDLVHDLRSAYHSTIPAGAVSGVDLALWDLRGNAAGASAATLLGGRRRDAVPAYATGHFWPPADEFETVRESVVSEAESHVDAGFGALKMKIGMQRHFGWGPEYDVELVRAVREAVGDDVALMADANHAYDLPAARRVADGLADLDVEFFEEPLPPDRIDAYARLAEDSDVSIAGGECWAFAPEFRRVANAGAVDVLQPDVTSAGGLTSSRRAAEIADAAGLATYPHVFGSAVALAASLQLLATLPGSPRLEFDRTPNPIREELAVDPIRNEGTEVPVPDGPGLGIEIDPETLAEFRVD
ncbi:mandelate racemase/muconate lactonizing enzyme family protein [Halobaculum magnesiiphilum]|uniref:Mandelate racemase/muconate lactonizing enzyme family protein n=1 Tax=Halobaculum magnesiiphilum TaxID=1017351 RepID=A0A8T8WEJ8_9EURY|nr:mandelate racemase/muconate lactonizing enzyme family protein [Halobaculum magnesiiphilum]QZP38292.1 mandelate racemase/muconate lactonizing enzyme family protein [Halobaculum magnesiiphilum]